MAGVELKREIRMRNHHCVHYWHSISDHCVLFLVWHDGTCGIGGQRDGNLAKTKSRWSFLFFLFSNEVGNRTFNFKEYNKWLASREASCNISLEVSTSNLRMSIITKVLDVSQIRAFGWVPVPPGIAELNSNSWLKNKESMLDVLFIELATLSCVRTSVFKVQCAPQARCPLIALRREATKGDA